MPESITLADVFRLNMMVETKKKVFALPPHFDEKYYSKLHRIGEILCTELGIELKRGLRLNQDQELTPEARKAFTDLIDWLEEWGFGLEE